MKQRSKYITVLASLFRKFFKYVNAVILRFRGIRYNLNTTKLFYYIT